MLLFGHFWPTTKPKRICQEYDQVSTLSQHSRCWKNSDDSGSLEPVWPHEPDIDVARKLAIACLPWDLFADADIKSFAQGSFHHVYCISSGLTAAKYMMRVALPVDPFFKTESEVATMEYIRRHSSIPVPRIVAYASSASNELGFEWILMGKVDGVPLDRVWDDMTFNAKMEFTVAFAGYMKQLRELQFPLFGSIYCRYLEPSGLYANTVGKRLSTIFQGSKRRYWYERLVRHWTHSIDALFPRQAPSSARAPRPL